MNHTQAKHPENPPPAVDLSYCELEPIHIPGAIQPHGAMLAARADGLLVTHASANLLDVLGRPAQPMLGRPLAQVLENAASLAPREPTLGDSIPTRLTSSMPGPNGGILHLGIYRSGRHIYVDIEPARPEPWQTPSIAMAQTILETFKQATKTSELLDLAVQGLRTISGYDRVIAYRFYADGHGEVCAEARAAELEPYLGIHYPASDVPSQARRQYLRQTVGAVGDSSYQPVPLLTHPDLDDGTPLDLTYSTLRSISPVHREYMRNMKTAASMTIALTQGQDLWGMLVCHHQTARLAGPDLRAVGGMIGQVVSLLLASLGTTELYVQRHHRQAVMHQLVDQLAAQAPLLDALVAPEQALLDLVDAAGALVSISGNIRCLGRTPPRAAAERALATLQLAAIDGTMLAIDNLGLRYPALADCTGDGSGALLLPLAQGTDDAILWFRPEQSRTVDWGGNPAEHATIEPFGMRPSPRVSFAAWKETVRGLAAPWQPIDLTFARDLQSAVDRALAQRLRSELAQARQDALAAEQPNRQRLRELEEFSYAASHDLRAPLRAIEHLAQWIGEDLGPAAKPDTIENLKLLQGRVRRLRALLDGLLAYSRVGRQTHAEIEAVDIAALVHDVVELLAPAPGFTVVCAGDMPVIHTHRAAIGVVLRNLISNGLQHHDRAEGRIAISLCLLDGLAEFRVGDDGPGIAPQFHDRIFVVFQTLTRRHNVEASGMGLAIVKKMVEAHGGQIWVESAPPTRGSTFVFTWREDVPS